MNDFNSEFDTLFIPLISSVYTSTKFPHILYDKKAMEIKDRIPSDIKPISKMVQYTYLSGTIRSKKIDNIIDDFLYLNPNGVVVELSSRLSTACYRCKAPSFKWYCVDNARNISIRKQLFGTKDNIIYIKGDIFKPIWIRQVERENPGCPIMVVAAGTFNYCAFTDVQKLFRNLCLVSNVEIIFDAVHSMGMKRMKKIYKHLGIKRPDLLFHLDNPDDIEIERINTIVLDNEPFFENVSKKKMKLITRLYMKIADTFKMINIYHISNH